MRKKIMIVDDSPEITFTVKDGLELLDSNYDVICLDGGKKCLEYLEKNEKPDIILLDIMMPGMNGWQVFKKLKENKNLSNTPIVFLTAKSDNFSKAFGKIIADAFIEKPFNINDLKQKIDNFIEKPNIISKTKEKVIEDMIHSIYE